LLYVCFNGVILEHFNNTVLKKYFELHNKKPYKMEYANDKLYINTTSDTIFVTDITHRKICTIYKKSD